MRRPHRLTYWTLGLVPGLATVVLGAGLVWLRGSLPDLDGTHRLAGLAAAVEVLRDADGIVTIRAGGELDAARALGYVHAQDRLWQMDFMRRTGAGRLSEVVGPETLGFDRLMRGLGLYRLAEASLDHLTPEVRALLETRLAELRWQLRALNRQRAGSGDRPMARTQGASRPTANQSSSSRIEARIQRILALLAKRGIEIR